MTEASTSSAGTPRHDYFQTATQVNISFYVKGCRQEDVQLDVKDEALSLTIVSPSPAVRVDFDPLYAPIDTTNSHVRVLSTKVEVSLQKKYPGNHWPKLLGVAQDPTPIKPSEELAIVPDYAAPPPSNQRSRSKWDTFKVEEEADDADVNDFFKKLYADADDDTRRAMMKSYQESGGTTLSTNWKDVSKGKVETRPPDGMEARKWD